MIGTIQIFLGSASPPPLDHGAPLRTQSHPHSEIPLFASVLLLSFSSTYYGVRTNAPPPRAGASPGGGVCPIFTYYVVITPTDVSSLRSNMHISKKIKC